MARNLIASIVRTSSGSRYVAAYIGALRDKQVGVEEFSTYEHAEEWLMNEAFAAGASIIWTENTITS
jgi:hypothetical protein